MPHKPTQYFNAIPHHYYDCLVPTIHGSVLPQIQLFITSVQKSGCPFARDNTSVAISQNSPDIVYGQSQIRTDDQKLQPGCSWDHHFFSVIRIYVLFIRNFHLKLILATWDRS